MNSNRFVCMHLIECKREHEPKYKQKPVSIKSHKIKALARAPQQLTPGAVHFIAFQQQQQKSNCFFAPSLLQARALGLVSFVCLLFN